MAIPPRLVISPLQERDPIVDDKQRPVASFIRALNKAFKNISSFVNYLAQLVIAIQAAQAAADAAQASADAAQATADAAAAGAGGNTAESSMVNSGIINVAVPPMITGYDDGSIALSDHDRRYGDPTMNPTVGVQGGGIATGEANPARIYIFYDDPMRAGGAVTYQWSLNAEDAIQGGDRHSVGSVTIPVTGTEEGDYVKPPGIT